MPLLARLNPFTPIRRRFRAWFESRLPLKDSTTLTQRNVYILPTRAGFMFAITLITLLLASINYQLNLGYVLTFLLAGSAVVSSTKWRSPEQKWLKNAQLRPTSTT